MCLEYISRFRYMLPKAQTTLVVLASIMIVISKPITWWRHQMETFSAVLAICAGNSPVSGEFPAQRPVPRSFDVFFDLRLNKRLSKQSWGWWFETLSRPLWRHCNDKTMYQDCCKQTALGIVCPLKIKSTSQGPFHNGVKVTVTAWWCILSENIHLPTSEYATHPQK